jgi:hypothetical protein
MIPSLNPLLDLDPTVYASGFAADAEIKRALGENGENVEDYKEIDYISFALSNAKTAVNNVLETFCDRQYYKGYLTGKGNFRYDVATIRPYKGNRDPSHKPKYYREIREYLVANYDVDVVEGIEADDAISIRQFANPDKSTCIVTIDKDLNMIPGYHYNPRTKSFWYQSLQDADLFFWWQMMVGDTTDNIVGVTGVGPKKADKLIAELGGDTSAIREAVSSMYQKQYGDTWQDAMREIATLLWMQRKEGDRPDV